MVGHAHLCLAHGLNLVLKGEAWAQRVVKAKHAGAYLRYVLLKSPNDHADRPRYFFFGTSLDRPSVAQELAAQVIGVKSFELPGEPSGVDREIIGQLPSGFCVATRKSIPRWISGRSAV
jgi:hypothetical protein